MLAALPATRVGGYRLDVNPEAKLRAVLSITRDLVGSDGLDRVLDRTLASLFNAFPQADRGFVMLADAPGGEPRIRATRTRPALGFGPVGGLNDGLNDGGGDGDDVRISRTIVRRVMETGEAILSVDADGDSRFDASSSLMDLQLRSVVCIPLTGRDEKPFGVLQLDTADPTRQFSEDDLDLLRAVSVPIGLAAENARLTVDAARRREAERDLELAARIQQGFLPQKPPPLEGYEFADRYESAQSVGGDYFDYIPLPDGRLAIALGDVSGKGVPAALLMVRMHSAARSCLLGAANKKNAALLPSALRRLNAELTARADGPPVHHLRDVAAGPENARPVRGERRPHGAADPHRRRRRRAAGGGQRGDAAGHRRHADLRGRLPHATARGGGADLHRRHHRGGPRGRRRPRRRR